VDMSKDLIESGARGAAGGALIGSVFPGVGTGAGAAYGALMNVLMVGYNAFLRKEQISPNQMRRLAFFVEQYTFRPTAYGELLPKKGYWMVNNKGYIRRYDLDLASDGRISKDASGNMRAYALDVAGNWIKKNQFARVNEAQFGFQQNVPADGKAAVEPSQFVPLKFRE
jgi:hypothetical protein